MLLEKLLSALYHFHAHQKARSLGNHLIQAPPIRIRSNPRIRIQAMDPRAGEFVKLKKLNPGQNSLTGYSGARRRTPTQIC